MGGRNYSHDLIAGGGGQNKRRGRNLFDKLCHETAETLCHGPYVLLGRGNP